MRKNENRTLKESPAKNDPKIEKLVNQVNQLIKSAVDSDGDPIAVVDKSGTWEEPYIYSPIEYKNGTLKITSTSEYNNIPEVEVINKRNMEYDGIPTLRNIAKLYKKAIRLKDKPVQEIKKSKKTFNLKEAVGPFQTNPIEVKIAQDEDSRWNAYLQTINGEEGLFPIGYETKEQAEHAAMTKGYWFDKNTSSKAYQYDRPKLTKHEPVKFDKPTEMKLEQYIRRLVKEERRKLRLSEAPKITKEIEAKLREAKQLQEEIDAAQAQIEKIIEETGMKAKEKRLNQLLRDDLWDFFDELKSVKQRLVELEDIIVTITTFQSEVQTFQYEKGFFFLLEKVNQATKGIALDMIKLTEKISKRKGSYSFKSKTEAVGDSFWDKLTNFFSKFLPSIKKKGEQVDKDIDKLKSMLDDMTNK